MKLSSNMFPVKPSVEDDRDFKIGIPLSSSKKEPIPDFQTTVKPIPIKQTINNCTNAGSAITLGAHLGVDLHPTYAYGNVKEGEYSGSGETCREVFKDIYRDGLPLLGSLPIGKDRAECIEIFHNAPEAVQIEARKHRWANYFRMSKKPNVFLRSMYNMDMPLNAAIPIYENAWREALATDGIVMPPKEGDKMIGGHFVTFDGKETNFIKLPNTWGKDAAVNGIQKLHVDYPIWETWLGIPYKPTRVSMYLHSNVYKVNGKVFKMDTKAKIVKDRLLVPLRFVFNALGYSFVDWDRDTQEATVQYGGYMLYFKANGGGFFDAYTLQDVKYDVGVTNVINDDDRMLVPVRKLFEFLGWRVRYNHDTKTITIDNYRED